MVHEPVEPGGARAEDVQERSRRFASLRAAQRALADTLHPHALQRSVEQGRAAAAENECQDVRHIDTVGRWVLERKSRGDLPSQSARTWRLVIKKYVPTLVSRSPPTARTGGAEVRLAA